MADVIEDRLEVYVPRVRQQCETCFYSIRLIQSESHVCNGCENYNRWVSDFASCALCKFFKDRPGGEKALCQLTTPPSTLDFRYGVCPKFEMAFEYQEG